LCGNQLYEGFKVNKFNINQKRKKFCNQNKKQIIIKKILIISFSKNKDYLFKINYSM